MEVVSISPLALGLGKLISKGDWSFWWGDGTWYDIKAPLTNGAWRAGDMILFSRHDNEVRFFVTGDRWDRDNNLLAIEDQAYLREIWMRLYYEPTMREQAERTKQLALEQEKSTRDRIEELERLGATP